MSTSMRNCGTRTPSIANSDAGALTWPLLTGQVYFHKFSRRGLYEHHQTVPMIADWIFHPMTPPMSGRDLLMCCLLAFSIRPADEARSTLRM